MPYMNISKGFRMYSDVIEISTTVWFYHTHNGKVYSIVSSKTEPCTIYLEWNSQDTDTIQATSVTIKSTKDKPLPGGICKVLAYDKIYYNGNLIVASWENNQEKMSQGIYPTIIKE
ncbi:MAG: hypothetical protein LBS50_01940 [Prevotellaceae bacterium]|nr:hypothetical protein [Prevotellaceae bacterium]